MPMILGIMLLTEIPTTMGLAIVAWATFIKDEPDRRLRNTRTRQWSVIWLTYCAVVGITTTLSYYVMAGLFHRS